MVDAKGYYWNFFKKYLPDYDGDSRVKQYDRLFSAYLNATDCNEVANLIDDMTAIDIELFRDAHSSFWMSVVANESPVKDVRMYWDFCEKFDAYYDYDQYNPALSDDLTKFLTNDYEGDDDVARDLADEYGEDKERAINDLLITELKIFERALSGYYTK